MSDLLKIITLPLLCAGLLCTGSTVFAVAAPDGPVFSSRILTDTAPLGGAEHKPATNGPVLIQFWASWCNRCASMFAELNEFARDYPRLPVIALSIDENETAARAYLAKHAAAPTKHTQISFRLDRSGVVAKEFQINAVPTVLLVSQDGRIISRAAGHIKKSDLLRFARQLTH